MSSLGTVPSAQNATNATNATTAATASAAPIAKVTYVASPISVPVTSGPATQATATCPVGTTVIGGGASIVDTTDGLVDDSYPNGKTAWTADFSDFVNPTTGTVTAICAPAAATAP